MNKLDRRQFLSSIAKPAAAASVVLSNPGLIAKTLNKVKKLFSEQNCSFRQINQLIAR